MYIDVEKKNTPSMQQKRLLHKKLRITIQPKGKGVKKKNTTA